MTRADFRPFLAQGFRWHTPERLHPVCSAEDWWAELEPVFTRAFKGVGLATPQAAAWAREVRGEYTDPRQWQVFPDTVPTLEQLTRDGWTHAILTNHVPDFRHLLAALGLTCHFAFIVNSAETGAEKPHPRAFAAVFDEAGTPEHLCMIGDSLHADIQGARQAGWPALLVRGQVGALAEVPEALGRLFN